MPEKYRYFCPICQKSFKKKRPIRTGPDGFSIIDSVYITTVRSEDSAEGTPTNITHSISLKSTDPICTACGFQIFFQALDQHVSIINKKTKPSGP